MYKLDSTIVIPKLKTEIGSTIPCTPVDIL